jgi:protein subunit release factor B
MTSTQERAEQRRRQKLAEVQAQIRSGSLIVRQMTADERTRYPPRPDAAPRRDRRLRS